MEVVNYTLILTLQIILIVYDIFVNAFIDLLNPENVIQLVLFVLQDICLLFQLVVLCLEIFNTTTSQAGFISRMMKKFAPCLIVTAIYLTLSVALCGQTLALRWADTSVNVYAHGGFYTIYILQRLWSPIYYYTYKRTAMRLADPIFYKNADWLRRQLSPR
uniref:Transmembrane protein 138 n=1 Tax=Ciona savignyi TaxID=51511 RepID=H2ZIE9_CIOSA